MSINVTGLSWLLCDIRFKAERLNQVLKKHAHQKRFIEATICNAYNVVVATEAHTDGEQMKSSGIYGEGDPRTAPSWYSKSAQLDWYANTPPKLYYVSDAEAEALHHWFRASNNAYDKLVKEFEKVRPPLLRDV